MFHSSFNRPSRDERYALLITFPDGSVHSFQVGDSAITIGRSPATAIRVIEDGVSRQHCVISRAGGRLAILDQGSTNGTYVNGALVKQARLTDGDVVQVGSARIEVTTSTDDDEMSSHLMMLLPEDEDEEIQTQTHDMTAQPHIQQRLAERLATSDGAASAGELVLGAVFEAFPVDRAFILTRRRDYAGVVPEVLASKTRVPNEDATGELDMSIPETVLKTLHSDPELTTAAEATLAIRAALKGRVSSPVMCAPLRHGGECFGALYLDALTMPEWAQGEEMLGFLSSLGAMAALAISRARLRAELNVEHKLAKLRQGQRSRGDGEQQPGMGAGVVAGEGGEEISARRGRRLTATVARGLVREVTALVGALNDDLAGAADVGSDDESDGPRAAALLEATARAGTIVAATEDVATMADVAAGTLVPILVGIDVEPVLEQAVARHAAKAATREVELALGPVEAGLRAFCDGGLLRRTLDHLVRNGLDRVDRGGRVVFSAKTHAAHVEIVVADTGPAVPTGRAADYFAPEPWSDDAGQGGGIWLYYCKLVTEAQGGGIAVTGLAGNSRVVITLPADEA